MREIDRQTAFICRFSPNGEIRLANFSAMFLFDPKITPESGLVYFWQTTDQYHANEVKKRIQQMEPRSPFVNFIAPATLPDSRSRWIQWQCVGDFNENGLVSIHASGADVTRIMEFGFHDKLTGLYSQSYLEETLAHIRTQRHHTFSVIIIDSDNLKITNDSRGHHFGDRLLVATAGMLKASCRIEDLIFRRGGDEFVLLINDPDKKAVENILHRMNFHQHEISAAQALPMEFSCGFAIQDGTKNIDQLLVEADEMMYREKKTKKNIR